MKNLLHFFLILILVSCKAEPNFYSLTLNVNPDNAATVPEYPSEYEEGSSVTINITPNSDWQFDSWSGDATGSENPLTIKMDRNKNITANFSVPNPIIGDWEGELTIYREAEGSIPAERNYYNNVYHFAADGTAIATETYVFTSISNSGVETIYQSDTFGRDGSWMSLSDDSESLTQIYSFLGLGNSPCQAEVRFSTGFNSFVSQNDCAFLMDMLLEKQ